MNIVKKKVVIFCVCANLAHFAYAADDLQPVDVVVQSKQERQPIVDLVVNPSHEKKELTQDQLRLVAVAIAEAIANQGVCVTAARAQQKSKGGLFKKQKASEQPSATRTMPVDSEKGGVEVVAKSLLESGQVSTHLEPMKGVLQAAFTQVVDRFHVHSSKKNGAKETVNITAVVHHTAQPSRAAVQSVKSLTQETLHTDMQQIIQATVSGLLHKYPTTDSIDFLEDAAKAKVAMVTAGAATEALKKASELTGITLSADLNQQLVELVVEHLASIAQLTVTTIEKSKCCKKAQAMGVAAFTKLSHDATAKKDSTSPIQAFEALMGAANISASGSLVASSVA